MPAHSTNQPMDLLYVIGPDSGHANRELRWSLRSVAKYARGLGRVVVAGYPPEWLSEEVVRFPFANEGRSKLRNQARALFAVVGAGALGSGEFAWTDDDVFLSAPLDLDALPFFSRGAALPTYERQSQGGEAYRQLLANTREALVEAGYPAVEAVGHAIRRMRASEADEARRLWEAAPEPGIELQAAFQNIRARRERVDFTRRKDWKLTAFDADAIASGMFSIGDRAFADGRVEEWLETSFGSPCRFERTGEHGEHGE